MQISPFYSKKRLIFFAVILILFMLFVITGYAKIIMRGAPAQAVKTPSAARGAILDRNGKSLALQTNYYHIGLKPSDFKSREDLMKFAALFAPPLGMTAAQIVSIISDASADFVYIKKRADQNTYEILSEIAAEHKYYFVSFDPVQGRTYPENELAAHVIGFFGDEGRGLEGIELTMQDVLSPHQAALHTGEQTLRGSDVYLTIDANLQYKLEKIAHEAMERTQAESFMLVAAEVKTGEILSYISLPSPNLNLYGTASLTEKLNRPARYSYEPGSVFKIFSSAALVDYGAVKETDKFTCNGKYEFVTSGGEKVRISCLGNHGSITVREALQYSCNSVLAQMTERVDSETFLALIKSFGFSTKTGIEISGESAGMLRSTADRLWSARSKPTIAIGQEISVTALQMVSAAQIIANKGVPIQLTLISKITDQDGSVPYTHVPAARNPVVSERTAKYLLSCMETTARAGTGSKAALGDISIGVKTGTAQMADPVKGGYSTTDFLSNCVAVFPVEDPSIVLYIVITKAKGETYAGRIVAPVIAETADVIIDHLGMARANASSLSHTGRISIMQNQPPEIGSVVPDLTGLPKRMVTHLLGRGSVNILIHGDGYAVSQNPPAGTPVTENMRIEIYFK